MREPGQWERKSRGSYCPYSPECVEGGYSAKLDFRFTEF